MSIFGFISSREQKHITLSEIIKNLNISEEEKELYILSLGVLGEDDFNIFYKKIIDQLEQHPSSSILPFSTQLL